jgi:hypothetical protein
MSHHPQQRQTTAKPLKPADRSAPTPAQGMGQRKRPWLLALAATLVASWIAFLAVMAWHG